MKKLLLSVSLFISCFQVSAFASQDDATISKFLRGNICRAIDTKYPNALTGIKTIPGWIVCRDGGALFSRWSPESDPNYFVIKANVEAVNPLNCTASVRYLGQAKTPSVVVACWN